MSNQIPSMPSYNPADAQSQTGMYEFIIKQVMSKLEKVAPAQILSYDRKRNRARVQILAQDITSNGEILPRVPIGNVPALMLAGGGFVISFPIKKDDIGWLVTSDRDISIFKNLLKMFAPNTYRKHKYESSFFIPDKVSGFEVSEEDTDALLITSYDGKTKLSIKPNEITLTAPTTTINGNLQVNGQINATGDVLGAGISLSTHIHSGVEPGSGTTGTPQ